jgi:hypothetical protein
MIKLIYNWRQCWRMVSVQAMTLAGAIQGAWLFIPEDMKASIPSTVVQWVTLALLGLGVAGRLVQQTKVTAP